MGDTDLLWAGTASAAIARPLDDKKAVKKARQAVQDEAGEMVRAFIEEHGGVSCIELIGVDLSVPGAREKARDSGVFDNCGEYVSFVIRKLYEIEENNQ